MRIIIAPSSGVRRDKDYNKIMWRGPIPNPNGLILATNAVVRRENEYLGLGGWFRDGVGTVHAAYAIWICSFADVEVAEALAIKEGIQLVMENQLPLKAVESDALRVVQGLIAHDCCNPNADIFCVVRDLLIRSNCGSCYYIPRTRNLVAHKLAAHAVLTTCNQT